MASIQDIQALEQKIYDAVEEYLQYPDGYDMRVTAKKVFKKRRIVNLLRYYCLVKK